jgi:hypothetical protein
VGADSKPRFDDSLIGGGQVREDGYFEAEFEPAAAYLVLVMLEGYRSSEFAFEKPGLCVDVRLRPAS